MRNDVQEVVPCLDECPQECGAVSVMDGKVFTEAGRCTGCEKHVLDNVVTKCEGILRKNIWKYRNLTAELQKKDHRLFIYETSHGGVTLYRWRSSGPGIWVYVEEPDENV